MWTTSSRDNWERLVAAVIKRDQIWQLCHQDSITTVDSDFTQRDLSLRSVPSSSSRLPLATDSVVQDIEVRKNGSGTITQKISALLWRKKHKDYYYDLDDYYDLGKELVGIPDIEVRKNGSRTITQKLFSALLWRKKHKDYDLGKGLLGIPEGLKRFSLQELQVATGNFNDKNILGPGGFGNVYKGRLADGRQVAIKRAETSASSSYAIALSDHLHKLQSTPLMSWPKRIKVALDAARGIEYLHEYAVIHRDIKSSNILLDSRWNAKVSDSGLSLLGPQEDESNLSLGTMGYMDPEYYRLQLLTTKSDVYSFGVVLLELLSGCKAIHKNENGEPRNVVDYVVPYIIQDDISRVLDRRAPPPTTFEIEAVAYVGYLASDCVMREGRDRPTMSEVVNSLDRALEACLAIQILSRSASISST